MSNKKKVEVEVGVGGKGIIWIKKYINIHEIFC